jgi:hypothetical protein
MSDDPMVLEKDYPMSSAQKRVLVIGLVVMLAIGFALFGGFIPGAKPNYSQPAIDTIGGHRYYVEPALLHYPIGSNATTPWNVTFHNVTFQLEMTGWDYLTGGILQGSGIEPNGTHYPFVLGVLPNGSRPTLYLSPDGVFGAAWIGGWLGPLAVQLLVEVPPSGGSPAV